MFNLNKIQPSVIEFNQNDERSLRLRRLISLLRLDSPPIKNNYFKNKPKFRCVSSKNWDSAIYKNKKKLEETFWNLKRSCLIETYGEWDQFSYSNNLKSEQNGIISEVKKGKP